jgi:hypothetical protein
MNTTIFGISKTTLEGWFSFLITTLTFVTGYNGFVALMNPDQSKIWLIASAVATFVVGLLNLWLRMLQGDGTANLAATPTSAATNSAGKVLMIFLALSISMCFISGCTNWERTTFQALSASKAVIDQAGVDYNAGTIPQTAANQSIITQARNAQTTAVDAMATYEEIKVSATTTVTGLSSQEAVVNTALAAVVPLVAQIKTLYATKTSMNVQPERMLPWTLQPYKTLSLKLKKTREPFLKPSPQLTRLLRFQLRPQKALFLLLAG